jgi:hypothetical protein
LPEPVAPTTRIDFFQDGFLDDRRVIEPLGLDFIDEGTGGAVLAVEGVGGDGDDAGVAVLVQRVDLRGAGADGKRGAGHHRPDDALEAAAVDRQLAFQDRLVVIDDGFVPGGDGAHGRQRVLLAVRAELDKTLARALHPEQAVGVQQHVLGFWVLQLRQHLRSQLPSKLLLQPRVLLHGSRHLGPKCALRNAV